MALPASGILTLGDIAAEFGGTSPHDLSEYYGSGGAPASGILAISDFYGLSAAPDVDLLGSASELTSAIALSKGWEIVESGAAMTWGTSYARVNSAVDGKVTNTAYLRHMNVPMTAGVTYTFGSYQNYEFSSGTNTTSTLQISIRNAAGTIYKAQSSSAGSTKTAVWTCDVTGTYTLYVIPVATVGSPGTMIEGFTYLTLTAS